MLLILSYFKTTYYRPNHFIYPTSRITILLKIRKCPFLSGIYMPLYFFIYYVRCVYIFNLYIRQCFIVTCSNTVSAVGQQKFLCELIFLQNVIEFLPTVATRTTHTMSQSMDVENLQTRPERTEMCKYDKDLRTNT